MGRTSYEKVIIKFKDDYDKSPLMTSLVPYNKKPSFLYFWKIKKDLWLGFTTTVYADNISKKKYSKKQVLMKALENFEKGFPNAKTKFIITNVVAKESKVTNWYDEPFSRGSYSFRGPNVNNTVEMGIDDPLLESHERLRFGGEYMAGIDF